MRMFRAYLARIEEALMPYDYLIHIMPFALIKSCLWYSTNNPSNKIIDYHWYSKLHPKIHLKTNNRGEYILMNI